MSYTPNQSLSTVSDTFTLSDTVLYSNGDMTIFRVYLSAIETLVLSQNEQFDIKVNGATGTSQLINTDVFVAPHANFNVNYQQSSTMLQQTVMEILFLQMELIRVG